MDSYGRPVTGAGYPTQYNSPTSYPMQQQQQQPSSYPQPPPSAGYQGSKPVYAPQPETSPQGYAQQQQGHVQQPTTPSSYPNIQQQPEQLQQSSTPTASATQQGVETPSNNTGPGPSTPPATPPTEERGFFKRLFSAGNSAPPSPPPPQQQVQVVNEAQGANCLPSKPMTPEEANELRNRPLGSSKFGCLNPATDAAATPGQPGGQNGYMAPPAAPIIPTTTPGLPGPPHDVAKFGPWLRFCNYDPQTRQYTATVLFLLHQSKSPTPPSLRFRDAHAKVPDVVVTGLHLDHYQGWNFWRFDLVVECGLAERKIAYNVVLPTDHLFSHHHRYHFVVPGVNQKWRWGFYSCNGFDKPEDEEALGGIQPLWRDVMHNHHEHPFHVMVGGGDQIYNDPVWDVPALREWCNLPSKEIRVAHPFTQDMVNQAFDYYFRAYVKHWSQPVFKDALATIPQMMVWDDHDIFDGWGSYPDYLQGCPVFQVRVGPETDMPNDGRWKDNSACVKDIWTTENGVYFIARKFYALFQQHTTVERAVKDMNAFGEFGWNTLSCFGSTTAMLMLDTRSERTDKQIIRPASWAMIQARLAALPASIRHVVVLATVPVMYPKIAGAESTVSWMSRGKPKGIINFFQKTGLADSILSQFGTVEILDDLVDHWGATVHEQERLHLVHMLQDLALSRGFRFTIVSGDVHAAGVGRFCSHPKKSLRQDHRYMPQIISSAIGNGPPPPAVITALSMSAKSSYLDKDTKEHMLNVFGVKKVLCDQRNWVMVDENPVTSGAGHSEGALVFRFRVEPNHKHHDMRPETYEVMVPPLDMPNTAQMAMLSMGQKPPDNLPIYGPASGPAPHAPPGAYQPPPAYQAPPGAQPPPAYQAPPGAQPYPTQGGAPAAYPPAAAPGSYPTVPAPAGAAPHGSTWPGQGQAGTPPGSPHAAPPGSPQAAYAPPPGTYPPPQSPGHGPQPTGHYPNAPQQPPPAGQHYPGIQHPSQLAGHPPAQYQPNAPQGGYPQPPAPPAGYHQPTGAPQAHPAPPGAPQMSPQGGAGYNGAPPPGQQYGSSQYPSQRVY